MKIFFQKIKENYKKYWDIYILVGLVLISLFVRSYHLEDFTLFRFDQARDLFYAKEALENGPENLRLLGPRAGAPVYLDGDESGRGETLSLGAIYYYFQYLSVLFFGSARPLATILPDFILSLLSIPLFYFLLRFFFSKKVGLLVVTLFAFSYMLVMYSRFAWNTNQLIFWEILFALAILKTAFGDEKARKYWLLVIFGSLSILSQLHFLAFFGFPAMLLVFWIFFPPQKINWKFWMMGVAIFALFYLPSLAGDIKNDGDNIKRILPVFLSEKNIGKEKENVFSKLSKTIRAHHRNHTLFATSLSHKELGKFEGWGILPFLIFVVFGGHYFWKKTGGKILSFREKIKDKKSGFLFLMILWSFAFWGIFFFIYSKLGKERFWLLVAPLIFVYWAVIFHLLMKVKNKIFSLGIIFLVMFVFLALNFSAILSFYQSLEKKEKVLLSGRSYLNVSEYDKFILFEDLLGVTNYLADYSKKEKRDICYFNTDYQTRKSMQYIFSHYFPKIKNVLGRSGNKDWDCDFFVLAQKKKGEDGIKELGEKYKVINREKDFGNMTLWRVDYLGEKGDVKVQTEEKGLPPKAEVIGDLWKKF